jgi:hypothetical protein
MISASLASRTRQGLAEIHRNQARRARGGCFRDLDGAGEAMVFSVTPAKVFAYAKGDPFGATTHRFRPT